MAIDLTQLTAEDIESLAALIKDGGNRTPAWKPLRDLREPQTAKARLNRPHFEWSADDDGQTVIKPYPRLMWDLTGKEHSIANEVDFKRRDADGWATSPPLTQPLTTVDAVQRELDMLSPEDRAWVLTAERDARLSRLKDRLSGLSAQERQGVSAAATPEGAVTAPVAEPAKKAKSA